MSRDSDPLLQFDTLISGYDPDGLQEAQAAVAELNGLVMYEPQAVIQALSSPPEEASGKVSEAEAISTSERGIAVNGLVGKVLEVTQNGKYLGYQDTAYDEIEGDPGLHLALAEAQSGRHRSQEAVEAAKRRVAIATILALATKRAATVEALPTQTGEVA